MRYSDPDSWQPYLTTQRLGREAIYNPQVESTQSVAGAAAAQGAPEGLLVLTDEQVAGRGRGRRRWYAPPGSSILMSLVLHPGIAATQAAQLTMCCGLATVEAIAQVTGVRVGLKWPNDILYEGRKLGGILTESQVQNNHVAVAILGMGLNVNLDCETARQSGLPLPERITSVSEAAGRSVGRAQLLLYFLSAYERRYDALLAGNSPLEEWQAHLVTLGQLVQVQTASGPVAGLAVGVTPEGGLRVRTADGQETVVWSGDVE